MLLVLNEKTNKKSKDAYEWGHREKETMYERAVFDLRIFGISVKTEYTWEGLNT